MIASNLILLKVRQTNISIFAYLTANGRQANCFHKLDEGSQYSTDRKTTLSSSPPTETITYLIPFKVLTQKYWLIIGFKKVSNYAEAMFIEELLSPVLFRHFFLVYIVWLCQILIYDLVADDIDVLLLLTACIPCFG